MDTAPRLAAKKLIIDLHNVTYADAAGKNVLKEIYAQTHAELVANIPWAQFSPKKSPQVEAANVKRESNNADDTRHNEHLQEHSQRAGEFFKKLSPAALQDLSRWSSPRCMQRSMLLFSEKDTPQGIFIVLAGEVKLSINSSEGQRLILSIARRREVLGLSSALVGHCPCEMTAEVLYPAHCHHRRAIISSLSLAVTPRSTRW